jgi:hypothetical protein
MKQLLDTGFERADSTNRSRVARPLPIRLAPPPKPPSKYRTNPLRWPRTIPVPLPNPNARFMGIVSNGGTSGTVETASVPTLSAIAYSVQIGAFRSSEQAVRELNQVLQGLPARHSPAYSLVQSYRDPESGVWYRARMIGYPTDGAAHATCDWLRNRAAQCAVIEGQG